jgi:ribonuclease HII
MIWLGLDEAGRGAVLGPLVVGGFLVPEDRVEAVRATGATDSKRLSARRREALIDPLRALGLGQVIHITPAQIDAENINRLEEQAFLALIRTHRPDGVIIDAPCNPRAIPNFTRRLLSGLDYVPKLIIEPKADLTYTTCGAASIFAKVSRDAAIAALGPVGSGYPSDPVTRAWISDHLKRSAPLPDCVRKRWGTINVLSQGLLFQDPNS